MRLGDVQDTTVCVLYDLVNGEIEALDRLRSEDGHDAAQMPQLLEAQDALSEEMLARGLAS
jgi:hypothetical protein